MSEQNSHRECFETAARVLFRCVVGGVIFLLIWFVAYVAAGDQMYRLQARWFHITRGQFELVNYCGIAAVKLFVILVFLIPYVCLRLVLRKKS